jgi:hypothetical protein
VNSLASEMPPTYSTGWMYVLENERMPNVLKIGFTKNSVQERVAELSSSTGVPLPFVCVYLCRVRNPAAVERSLHQQLAQRNAGKEFFEVSLETAIIAIEDVAERQNAELIEQWRHPKYAMASPTQVTYRSTATTRSPEVTAPASPAPAITRRPLGEIAKGQLTPEIARTGAASASIVWVPLKGHRHES